MRYKGRYINDRKFQNVAADKDKIVECYRGNGIIELRKEIDAICMEPYREPVDKKHNIKIYISLVIAIILAVGSVIGLFYHGIFGISFILSIMWIAFVFWVNRV